MLLAALNGHHYDRRFGKRGIRTLAKLTDELYAVHPRHPVAGDQEVRNVAAFQQVQGLLAILNLAYVATASSTWRKRRGWWTGALRT